MLASKLEQELGTWTEKIKRCVEEELASQGEGDASHGMDHLERVAKLALEIADKESFITVNPLVVLAAGLMHDIVTLPKNHPDRKKSSQLAAERAAELLAELNFPPELIPGVAHAIEAHSFSAQITPESIEAKFVQDADRMESLGALGILRTFYVGGRLQSKLYHADDPTGECRDLDDSRYSLDHFPCKLFTLYGTMQTKAGKELAKQRTNFLQAFYNRMLREIHAGDTSGAAHSIAQKTREAGHQGTCLFVPMEELKTQENPPFINAFLEQLDHECQRC